MKTKDLYLMYAKVKLSDQLERELIAVKKKW